LFVLNILGLSSEPVLKLSRKEKYLAPTGNRTQIPLSSTRNLLTALPALSAIRLDKNGEGIYREGMGVESARQPNSKIWIKSVNLKLIHRIRSSKLILKIDTCRPVYDYKFYYGI
jgi:hypothetical protein